MPDQDADSVGNDPVRPGHSPGPLMSILGLVGMVAVGVVLVMVGSGSSADRSDGPKVTCRALLKGRECPVFTLAWSPDGRKLAVSGFGPVVRLWDRESGQVHSIEGGTEQPRFLLGWAGDGQQLVLGGIEVPVESWDLVAGGPDQGRSVTRPEGRAGTVQAIARATQGAPIRVRGVIDQRTEWLPRSEYAAVSAAFAPDGSAVVTAEVDQAVRIWDVPSGRLRHTFRGDWRGMSCVAFSPDGSKVASGGGGSLNVWDANSGALLATLGGAKGGSAIIGFPPDGKSLAGAGWDGAIRIWEVATGRERAKLGGHDGQVLALAWSPDGTTIATGGYDSTVRLWDAAVPVAVARAD